MSAAIAAAILRRMEAEQPEATARKVKTMADAQEYMNVKGAPAAVLRALSLLPPEAWEPEAVGDKHAARLMAVVKEHNPEQLAAVENALAVIRTTA